MSSAVPSAASPADSSAATVTTGRRTVALAAAATLLGSGLLTAALAAETGPVGLGLPKAGCNTATDPKGDGIPVSQGPAVPPIPNDPDLDITGLVFGDTAKQLSVVFRVDKLAAAPSAGVGHLFVAEFKAGAKLVELETSRYSPEPVQTAYRTALRQDLVSIDGSLNTAIPITVEYDTKNSLVIMSVDRPALEKALGAPLATLTAIKGLSSYSAIAVSFGADAITGTAPYTMGGNECFGDSGGAPAPAPTGAPSGSAAPAPSGSAAPAPSGSASPAPSGSPAPGGSGGFLAAPRKECVTIPDAAGDANPIAAADNEASLDVTAVNLLSKPDVLQTWVKLANPSAGTRPVFTTKRYDVTFTANGKAVVVSVPGAAAGTTTVGGTAAPDAKTTAAIDTKASSLVISVDRAGLAKALGADLTDGTVLSKLGVATFAGNAATTRAADTAQKAKVEEQVYAVGDNSCFLPPAGKLAIEADPKGQFGDTTVLFATLTDSSDAAVAGVSVSVRMGNGSAVSATTDAEGIAEIAMPLRVKAGSTNLTASFAGNDTVGAAGASAPFTVVAEKTVLTAKGGRGAVTATMLDDDRKAVAGQAVTFTQGKLKKTVKTGSTGIAKAAGFKPGAVVTVSYPGAAGMYTAAKTTAKA